MKRLSECNHEKSEVWVTYCSGFTNEKLQVEEIKKCVDCGWTWRERHTGRYIQETKSEIIEDEKIKVNKQIVIINYYNFWI